MHTFLKTAYVHFRLPSLVERAHIPRESISARLPASPLRPPCLPPAPHRPSLVFLLPLSSGTRIHPLTHTFSRVLHFLRHTVHRCTTPWGSAECGAVRSGARGEEERERSGAAVRL